MKSSRHIGFIALALCLTLLTAGCGGDDNNEQGNVVTPAGATGFSGILAGSQEVPAVSTTATGTGSFALNGAETELSFNITVTGLSGAITAAHFHNAAAGVNGGVVRTLTADFVNNTASGIWKSTDSEPLTSALVTELKAGNIYVNVHTAANAAGEIRAQLIPITTGNKSFTAMIVGAQEVPAVSTTATGTGSFALNGAETELSFNITVTGLSGAITAAHFHNAATGVNGGVVRTLTADFVNNTASGIWKSTDSEPLTSALVTELKAGNIYVNVHTAANAAGEIRGQVLLSTN